MRCTVVVAEPERYIGDWPGKEVQVREEQWRSKSEREVDAAAVELIFSLRSSDAYPLLIGWQGCVPEIDDAKKPVGTTVHPDDAKEGLRLACPMPGAFAV